MKITREDIVNILNNKFINDDNVYAFWLEGSDVLGKVDQYSDIDIWFDVEDGYEDRFIKEIKKNLESLSDIEYFYEKSHDHPKIRQMFIHLENTSKFLIIDLCVQSHSREIYFTVENKDEVAEVIFDKSNVVKYRHLKSDSIKNDINRRTAEIKELIKYYLLLTEKEIKRTNYLEALNYYHNYFLKTLVEFCRIKNCPTKKDFYLKHIKRDLPGYVLENLEYFYKVSSIEEIDNKVREANKFFHRMANEANSY